MFVSMVILAFLSRERKTPDYLLVLRTGAEAPQPSPLEKVDFSSPPRAMKKTEEVLPQYEFAAR